MALLPTACGSAVTPDPAAPPVATAPISKPTAPAPTTPAPPTATKAPATKAPEPTKPPAQSKWDTTLAAAKTEGSLLVYTTANPATTQALSRAFKDKYGITVEFIVGRGEELVQRISTENRAGLYLGDLLLAGGTTLLLTLKPTGAMAPIDSTLILPQVASADQWRGKALPFLDKDHQVLAFVNQTASHVAVNSEAVKEGDIKSFGDLVDPRWKGKIVMDDPTVSGAADDWTHLMLVIYGPQKGKEFLQKIAAQDPMILRDKRSVVEWLARNKYQIAIGPDLQTFSEFKVNGAPIKYLRASEGSASLAGGGCLALLKQTAHPNASTIFVNWLLTKEGQTIFQKNYGTPSARLDMDMTGIDPAFVPQEGEKLISTTSDEWYAGKAAGVQLVKEIFQPLMGK